MQGRCELRFPKKPLFSPLLILLPLEALDLGGAPLRYSEAQGPFLSAKLLFVRIAAADVKLPLNLLLIIVFTGVLSLLM